jgi:dipeptidase D
MISVYEKLYGKNPIVETMHAGLECGILSDKISDLDAVSIGPDMWDIHTPRERISISSVKRVYEFICQILSEI